MHQQWERREMRKKKIGRKTYRKLTTVRMQEKLIVKLSSRNITLGCGTYSCKISEVCHRGREILQQVGK